MTRVLAYGPSALMLELASADEARAAYAAVRDLVDTADLPGPSDVVPAARTVLLDGLDDVPGWTRALERLTLDRHDPPEARHHDVPVTFDGPDLEVVADVWGCRLSEVVDRLVGPELVVDFCGFAPGFAYCRAADDPWPTVPRRDEPRSRVPAGSVALAGDYLGWYPGASPGGWQLVGATDVTLFDVRAERPALFAPGDRIRIEPVR